MPGGILTGDGSQGNPYIVMDGYDLNALRTLVVTSGVYPYVELGADIDMSVYPVFTPIPQAYCNFDGKNHRIYNLNIVTATAYAGLFAGLRTADTKNIYVEGSVICSNVSSNGVGIFAGILYLTTSAGKVSNIHCSGYIEGSGFGTMTRMGGVCSTLQNSDATNLTGVMDSCSFHGTIKAIMAGTYTTIDSQTPYVGGIVGWADTYSGSGAVTVSRCISNFTVIYDSSTSNFGFGGIVGLLRSYGGKQVTVDRCVSQMVQQIITAAASTRTLLIGGIAAFSYYATSQISRCAAHLKFQYDPPSTIAAVYFAGILAYWNATCNIVTSYSVVSIANPNSKPLPATFTVDGIQANGTRNITASFYDADVLTASFSGSVVDASTGRTTAQLKSQAYLESQGWVF